LISTSIQPSKVFKLIIDDAFYNKNGVKVASVNFSWSYFFKNLLGGELKFESPSENESSGFISINSCFLQRVRTPWIIEELNAGVNPFVILNM